MLNYICNNQCLVCGKFEDIKYIYIIEQNIFLYFHPDCFEEASGEKPVRGKRFTKEEWLDFAGEEYSLAENCCVEDIYRTKQWYLNGQYHREDGPAIEWFSGHKEWFLNGIGLSEQEFNKQLKIQQLKKS